MCRLAMSTATSPSHNPVLEVFGDYFWSSDRNITEGVNVLYEASKVSTNNTKLLADLFQDHLEMEREYNKRLRKLSDKVRCVTDDKNTIAPIWKNMSTMYTSMSEMHSHYLKDLALTQKSFSNYSTEEKKTASSLTKHWEQANSLKHNYNKSFQQYSTSKSQFYIVSQTVQKSNHLEVAGSIDNSEQEGELVRSQEEYKHSVSKHQSSVQQTVDRLFSIFVEFECFEKNRITKVCEMVQDFMTIFSKFFIRVSKIIEGTGEGILSIENSKESILIDFATRYGTKGHRPLSPCYDDPPNVVELETELGPRPIYRSPSGQSIDSDKSKPGTPKPKKSNKTGGKNDPEKKKSKSHNFFKKPPKNHSDTSEPSAHNPNYSEQSITLSNSPLPEDTLMPGFIIDENGYRVRVEDDGTSPSPHPRSDSDSSDTDTDTDKDTSDVLRNMRINRKKTQMDKSTDNTADLYQVIDKLQLGAPPTNLSARKSNSANQLTHGTALSVENLMAPSNKVNNPLEDIFLNSSYNRRQFSTPRESQMDQDSEPDRTRTPTPVESSQGTGAFPQVSGNSSYLSNFSSEFLSPAINPKLNAIPQLSKENDFTFTSNFSKNDVSTLNNNPLSFSSFVPLPPPIVPLPPPITNSVLRQKPSNKLSIGNRLIQIIPETDVSPIDSIESPVRSPEADITPRPDSSMSFTSEVARSNSPGSDTTPIAINLQEKIHVFYKQNQLTERFVKLEGILTIAFLSNTIESIHQQDLVFTLEGDNLGGLKCLQQDLLSQEGEEFHFKMEPLKDYLLQQRAATRGQSFTVLRALGYSVKIPPSAPPLLLAVTWDPDSMADQTTVDIEYKYNPDGFPILSPRPLEEVIFTVKYGGKISEVELTPPGQHVKPHNVVTWKRDIVSSQLNATGKLTAAFTHFPDLKMTHVVEVSFRVNQTLSSTQFKLKRPGYSIARTKRSLLSGVYKSEN